MKSLEIIDKYIGTVYALSDDELKQIKQDLEVLEIIKESHIGDDDIFIRFLIASYTDIDKYNKVKQWLEEQEWQ